MNKGPFAPLGHGLLVEAVPDGQLFERSLRSLDRRIKAIGTVSAVNNGSMFRNDWENNVKSIDALPQALLHVSGSIRGAHFCKTGEKRWEDHFRFVPPSSASPPRQARGDFGGARAEDNATA